MAKYKGGRFQPSGQVHVFQDDNYLQLAPSLRVWNHSPTGFEWGYGGSGPAQLALALLMCETNHDEAVYRHQAFKWEVVAMFAKDTWHLTSDDIQLWLAVQRKRVKMPGEGEIF